MSLSIPQSYEDEFCEIVDRLYKKYPEDIFRLEGIHPEQMDINRSAREFFKHRKDNSTTADHSIDGTSNISNNSMITFFHEVPKPGLKLNSIYNIWKHIREDYSLERANEILEMEISGDIYINDSFDTSRPYSYHPGTTIVLKSGDNISVVTMESLFYNYFDMIVDKGDYEEIDLKGLNLKVYEQDKWVNLERVLRHKTDKRLLRFETKKGNVFTVTEDHPCILSDESEKLAVDVKIGDSILSHPAGSYSKDITNKIIVNPYRAYAIGALIGDGSVGRGGFTLYQKDVEQSGFYDIFVKLFGEPGKDKSGRKLRYADVKSASWLMKNIGTNSFDRHLPDNFLNWDRESQMALLAGLIDTDGTVGKDNGVICIGMISLGAIQQIAELATILGFNRVRTSISKIYKSKSSNIISNNPLYKVTFSTRDENCPLFKYSFKARNAKEMIIKERQKDGRFETDVVLKIDETKPVEYVYDITTSSGRFYSNGHIVHNCYNYSTLDLAKKGLPVSGRLIIVPPKSLTSFLHQVEQFVVTAANLTLGATGLADLLIVASLYIDKMLNTGMDHHIRVACGSTREEREEEVWIYVREALAHLIYTLNFEFRGNQSPFTNISIYDDYFMMQLAPNYELDGKTPDLDTIRKAQDVFIDVMNAELERNPITFPVTTACISVVNRDGKRIPQDMNFIKHISEKNLKNAFMNIYVGETSTLSSCCRLRSSISDLGYTNNFGSGSTKIGSLGVVTVNLPRLAKKSRDAKEDFKGFLERVTKMTEVVGIINNSKRKIILDKIERGALPLYPLGFMDINTQYSTVGFNGLYEAMGILGHNMKTDDGVDHAAMTLDTINNENNILSEKFGTPHNMEQVPAESSAVKLVKKDRILGTFKDLPEWDVPIYSNQFLPLWEEGIDLLDRIEIQGKLDQKCTGGAVCHLNVDQQIKNPETMEKLILHSVEKGVIYFAINYQINKCKNNHMSVGRNLEKCPICGNPIEDTYTRVVGFLVNTKNFTKERREHDWPNRVFYKNARLD